MDRKIKKIIAKEFLVLCQVLSICLVFLAGTYAYNIYLVSRVRSTEKQMGDEYYIVDSLKQPLKSKLDKREIFGIFYEPSDTLLGKQVWQTLEHLAATDSFSYRWNSVWKDDIKENYISLGFKNPDTIRNFILSCIITEQDINNSALADRKKQTDIAKLIELRTDLQHSMVLPINVVNQPFLSVFILSIILLGLRYLFKAIKWSLKTVKE